MSNESIDNLPEISFPAGPLNNLVITENGVTNKISFDNLTSSVLGGVGTGPFYSASLQTLIPQAGGQFLDLHLSTTTPSEPEKVLAVVPETQTYKDLTVHVKTNNFDFDSELVLQLDEADTDMKVTIPAGATGHVTSIGSVLAFKGQLINFRFNVAIGEVPPAELTDVVASFNVDASNSGTTPFYSADRAELLSEESFLDLHMTTVGTSTDVRTAVPQTQTWRDLTVHINTNDLNNDSTLTLQVEGSDTAMTVLIPANQAGTFTSVGSVDILEGQEVNFHFVAPTEGAVMTNMLVSFNIEMGGVGTAPFFSADLEDLLNEAAFYDLHLGTKSIIDDSFVHSAAPLTQVYRDLTVHVKESDFVLESELIMQINGVDTEMRITIPDGHVGHVTSTGSVLITKGQEINFRFAPDEDETGTTMEKVTVSFNVDVPGAGSGEGEFLLLTGGTMSGDIIMGDNNISDVNVLTSKRLDVTDVSEPAIQMREIPVSPSTGPFAGMNFQTATLTTSQAIYAALSFVAVDNTLATLSGAIRLQVERADTTGEPETLLEVNGGVDGTADAQIILFDNALQFAEKSTTPSNFPPRDTGVIYAKQGTSGFSEPFWQDETGTQFSILGGGATTLNDLTDVTITPTVVSGALLIANASQTFENITMSGDATISSVGALTLNSNVVTYFKMQNITNANTVLGSLSANSSVVELTGTQVTGILDVFAGSTVGLVPVGSGVATDYLDGTGNFSVPPGVGVFLPLAGGTMLAPIIFNNPTGPNPEITAVDTTVGRNIQINGDLTFLTTAQISNVNSIAGSLDHIVFDIIDTVDAVNSFALTNAATGNSPSIGVVGSDTDISLTLFTVGAGVILPTADIVMETNNILNTGKIDFATPETSAYSLSQLNKVFTLSEPDLGDGLYNFTMGLGTIQLIASLENGGTEEYQTFIIEGLGSAKPAFTMDTEITTLDDTGVVPVTRWNTHIPSVGGILTRPLFEIANDSTGVFQISAAGNTDLLNNDLINIGTPTISGLALFSGVIDNDNDVLMIVDQSAGTMKRITSNQLQAAGGPNIENAPLFTSILTPIDNGTFFFSVMSHMRVTTTVLAQVQSVVTTPARFRNLSVFVSANDGTGGDTLVHFHVGTSDEITLTIVEGNTGFITIPDSVDVAAGDLISYRVVVPNLTSPIDIESISMTQDINVGGGPFNGGGVYINAKVDGNIFFNPDVAFSLDLAESSTNHEDILTVVPDDIVISRPTMYVKGNLSTFNGVADLTLMVNNMASAVKIPIPTDGTIPDDTILIGEGVVSVAAGSTLHWDILGTSTGGQLTGNIAFSTGGTGSFLALDGGNMTGDILLDDGSDLQFRDVADLGYNVLETLLDPELSGPDVLAFTPNNGSERIISESTSQIIRMNTAQIYGASDPETNIDDMVYTLPNRPNRIALITFTIMVMPAQNGRQIQYIVRKNGNIVYQEDHGTGSGMEVDISQIIIPLEQDGEQLVVSYVTDGINNSTNGNFITSIDFPDGGSRIVSLEM